LFAEAIVLLDSLVFVEITKCRYGCNTKRCLNAGSVMLLPVVESLSSSIDELIVKQKDELLKL
jgi:hypothetical protein